MNVQVEEIKNIFFPVSRCSQVEKRRLYFSEVSDVCAVLAQMLISADILEAPVRR